MREEVNYSWPHVAVAKGANGALVLSVNPKRGKWYIVVVTMSWAISFWTGLELNHHATHLSALIQGIWGVGRPRWPRATSFYTMHGPAGGVNF